MHEASPAHAGRGGNSSEASACGLAAKIVWRGSCTCLFWNLAGLSEISKPGRQRRFQQSGGPCNFPFLKDRPGGSRTMPLRSGPPPVPFQGAGIMAVLVTSPVTDPTPEMVGRVLRVFLSPTLFLCSDSGLSLSFSSFSFFSPGSQSCFWLCPPVPTHSSGGLSAPCLNNCSNVLTRPFPNKTSAHARVRAGVVLLSSKVATGGGTTLSRRPGKCRVCGEKPRVQALGYCFAFQVTFFGFCPLHDILWPMCWHSRASA